MTAPIVQYAAVYGNVSVITDGEWQDTYTMESELEKSHLYKSSDLLEEMWVQIDLGQERLVCAVNVYSRRGKYLHNLFLSQKQKYSWQRINEGKSTYSNIFPISSSQQRTLLE